MTAPLERVSGSRLAMFLLGATLALGFTLSAWMLSAALVRMRQDHTIKVKGTAETEIVSDTATWKAGYVARHAALKDAYEQLARHRDEVKQFLKNAGVPDDELVFEAVSVAPQFRHAADGSATNDIELYELRQTVEVKSGNVQKVAEVSSRVTDLIRNGLEIRSFAPAYTYRGIEQIKLDLLAKATRNAYDRATTLAEGSRGRVGTLSSASQGVFQITPVDGTEVSDYGSYDTTTIRKTVKAVVTLEYTIEK